MKKILITGGAGFVGRRFVKHFLDQKHKVIVVDNLAKLTGGLHPKKWTLFNPFDYKNFYFYKADCRDWFKNNNQSDFDYVLHLAAMVGGREVIENNPLAVADDLSIDSHYWQWAQRNKPKKTLCFSSSACYPINLQKKNNYRLLKENDIDLTKNISMPDLTYGWAKLTCEYLAKIAYEKHGLKSVCYRPFSGYGEDQDLNYPFTSICLRILKNYKKKRIQVWGTGNQMRDFIHIDDCVNAVIKTMDKIENGDALNLSNGRFVSFKAFARKTSLILGFSPKIIGTSNKPEGVFARGGDTLKQKRFGIKNKILLSKGIEKTLKYLNKIYKIL